VVKPMWRKFPGPCSRHLYAGHTKIWIEATSQYRER